MDVNKRIAQVICDATELTGYSGKRWANRAHALREYVDLVGVVLEKCASFGYSALPVDLQGDNEVCRIEGEAIIVVVERVIENNTVRYDTAVCCRELEMRPIIAKALKPIVAKYGEKEWALIESFLTITNDKEPSQ